MSEYGIFEAMAQERRIAALEAENAEAKRYRDAVEWCATYWADIEFAYKHCEIVRLEPGQGEHRLFRAETFLEAVALAMAAPPFTGETVPERRDKIAAFSASSAALREDKARLVEALERICNIVEMRIAEITAQMPACIVRDARPSTPPTKEEHDEEKGD